MAITQDQIKNARSGIYESTMKFGLMGKPPKKVKPSDDQPGMLSSVAEKVAWAINYFSKDEDNGQTVVENNVQPWAMRPLVDLEAEGFRAEVNAADLTFKGPAQKFSRIPLNDEDIKPEFGISPTDMKNQIESSNNAVATALGSNVAASDAAPVAAVPTLTPEEQTKVDKALRAGLMARATEQGSKLDGADKVDLDVFAWRGAGSNTERIANTPLLQSSFKDIATAENPPDGAMVHLDSENIITLLNGVVPTGGLTFRGRPINAREHTLTPPQLSEVDYSNAVSQGINRSDYEDGQVGYDKWSKAVFTVYTDKVREQAGLQSTENNTNALVNNDVAFDDLPDGAKKMLYDVGWNGGPGSVKWSGVSTSAYEASKPIEDQTTDNLIAITKHFGTGESARGVLKRRVMEYNNIAKPGETATNINTTPWNDANGNRKGTTYAIQTAGGTTLKTYSKLDLTPILGDLEVPQGG